MTTGSGIYQVIEDFCQLISRHDEENGYQAAKGQSSLLQYLWFAYQRHCGQIDWILSRRCRKLSEPVRSVLHWAIIECYFCNGLPAAIAVNNAAGYIKARISKSASAFVNAVLRQLLRDAPDAETLVSTVLANAPEYIRAALPEGLYSRWIKCYGAQKTADMAAVLMETADITARRRGCFIGQNYGRPYPAGGVMMTSDKEFDPAIYYMQDSSTLLAPMLLSPMAGESIADLCAAPGGKALIIAEMLNHTGRLLCCDKSPDRLEKVKENLRDFPETDIEVMDMTCMDKSLIAPRSLDAILLDVPCTNSGVIRRRPDVRWNFAEKKLRDLTVMQYQILENASRFIKPNGRIVYSTCSIDPDENITLVRRFVSAHPECTLESARQLLPTHLHDGAFAALIRW